MCDTKVYCTIHGIQLAPVHPCPICEREKPSLQEVQKAFNKFALDVYTAAIIGRADAAIVANQEFNEGHALQEVKALARYAKFLEAELEKSRAKS